MAALVFVGVSEFGGIDATNPPGWQVGSWIAFLAVIVILTLVLAYACVKALKRK